MIIRILAGAGLALLGLACAGGAAARRPEPVAFEIRGVVVDARTRAPAAAVLVWLPEMEMGDATDAAGVFRVRARAAPGRYVMTLARIGYAPRRRDFRIRRAGVLDLGTFTMREEVMQLDDLIVPDCMRYARPPADTAPGATVLAETDSAGAYWMVCRPPGR